MSRERFSPELYRRYNLDLRELADEAALRHFEASQGERRIYGATHSTAEFLSMRWLRGRGLEVGAGSHPTPLFGDATAAMADCDQDLRFGGERIDLQGSVDSPEFRQLGRRFDFCIASHVLEHVDSFLRALQNLLCVTLEGGIVYLVLPDIGFLHDKDWLPHFDFAHHLDEFQAPLQYAGLHDSLYAGSVAGAIDAPNVHADLSDAYKAAVKAGVIPQEMRFIHHKHNYDFAGWLALMMEAQRFFDGAFRIADVRYGHERMDCHFVLEVRTGADCEESTPLLARQE